MICAACLFAVPVCLTILIFTRFRRSSFSLKGKHVVVTGGSSGIGKCAAIICARKGAHVTIVARNQARLDEAKAEIEQNRASETTQKIQTLSVDLCESFDRVADAFATVAESAGPIAMLVNCAGTAVSGRFDEIDMGQFKNMMDTNYFSAVHATRASLPSMLKHQAGRIVLVSSQAGQLGLFGYTAYSASKFALRGLAESLQMEVACHNIRITVAFPPDTDTPGFSEEEKTKPIETRLISDSAGLYTAEHVANALIHDSLAGTFHCSIGLDGYVLANLAAGMSPVYNLTDGVMQVLTMSLFRLVSFVYLRGFYGIVERCKKRSEDTDAFRAKTE